MPASPEPVASAGIVDVVRDFLRAHAALRHLAARFRQGELAFPEVAALVGDSDASLLFRLKERCHSLFRDVGPGSTVGREALFDLAVGALFHEAMKLREGVYQQTVYAPKVRALRAAAGRDADPLFGAFDAMLRAGAERLAETLEEVESLLYQTRGELHALLQTRRADGRLARFLVENPEPVAEVFGRPADEVLAEIHGDARVAWELAAHSYLESGFFAEAEQALEKAARDGGPPLDCLRDYARGMQAYLEGRFPESVAALERWEAASREAGPRDARLAGRAADALAKVRELAEGGSADPVSTAATALAKRLRAAS